MSVSIRLESNQPLVQRVFAELRRMGANPQPLLRDIAQLGENSTRARFRSQTGPDGRRWKPSLRALLNGGKTLTKDGHLGDSISSDADNQAAEWGSNRIYAAIQQFGGTIKPVMAKHLRFAIPGLGWRSARQVTLPARPYLGMSAEDEQDILHLACDYISDLIRRSAPRGA